jgi:hypothetical protein
LNWHSVALPPSHSLWHFIKHSRRSGEHRRGHGGAPPRPPPPRAGTGELTPGRRRERGLGRARPGHRRWARGNATVKCEWELAPALCYVFALVLWAQISPPASPHPIPKPKPTAAGRPSASSAPLRSAAAALLLR